MDDGFKGLKLTNTMTRQKEELRPLDWRDASIADADKRVRLYVCGPTVYDFAHIGNARPVIVFDVLFRLLRHLYGADRVTYVRNITDVDDKINARALRDHPDLPLNEAIRQVTETTAAQFQKDAAALGCLPPTVQPRATDFVLPRMDGRPNMVSMIEELIKKGHAYEAGGEVLFDVTSMADYGRLSNRKLEDQQAGARVAVDAHKRNPGDFVLWKLSAADEPGWASPWGRGRPGWHIECSVMAEAYLGRTFDIHGGGLDLIFPHHENEIAQSRCAHGTDAMAQIWMHNGFLQLEGKKMSKSDGNFVTISELLETEMFGGRKWSGEVLRLAMLMTHYREPIDFGVKRLEEAKSRLEKWRSKVSILSAEQMGAPNQQVIDALNDDLNFSRILPILDSLSNGARTDDNVTEMSSTLHFLGLHQSAESAVDLMMPFTEGYDELIDSHGSNWPSADLKRHDLLLASRTNVFLQLTERLKLLADKQFSAADSIRDELLAEGIQLKDGKDPATGERVTTWEVKR